MVPPKAAVMYRCCDLVARNLPFGKTDHEEWGSVSIVRGNSELQTDEAGDRSNRERQRFARSSRGMDW